MIQRVVAKLSGERGVLLTTLLAVVISLPALRLGFQADDHSLMLLLRYGQSPFRLFTFVPSIMAEERSKGVFAWWSSPQLGGELLRPLSSLSMAVQFWTTPSSPWLMLLVNVLIYGAAVWFAARLYRRLAPTLEIAALAGLMFAIDDAHAHSVGWISGRNTILALLGSLAGFWFHVRASDTGQRRYTVASALAVIFALASGEAGVWAYIYMIAFSLVLDQRPLAVRARMLVPQLVIGALWAAIYLHGHYGFHHTSWYQELSSPLAALEHGVLNLPLSVTSLLGPSLIMLAIFEPLWKARLLLLPIALGLLWLVWPALRASSGTARTSRFFALVTALGIVPAFLTVPQDRLLIGAGFGAFGWIATVLADADGKSTARHRSARVLLLSCHIGMAAVLFIPMLGAQYRFEVASQALRALVKPDRVVVLINTPVELLANYVGAIIDLENDPRQRPRALHQLYAGASELWLERTSDRSLELTATRGWGYVPLERILCAPQDMPKAGDERRVRGMTVRTLATNDQGMPERVRFTFDVPLESDELEWLVWTKAGHAVPFQPPALGERSRIAPLNQLEAMP